MLRISGYIGDENFDGDIKPFVLLEKLELGDYFKPLIDQFSYVEVGLKDRKVDAFNQPVTPASFSQPSRNWVKGYTPKTKKEYEFEIVYYEGTRKARDGRTNMIVQEYHPPRIKMEATSVFSKQYDGLKDFEKMCALLFSVHVSSPIQKRENARLEFKNKFQEGQDMLNKEKTVFTFQDKIFTEDPVVLAYRGLSIGIDMELSHEMRQVKFLDVLKQDLEKISNAFANVGYAKGVVEEALRNKIITPKTQTETTIEWQGLDALTGVKTTQGGDNAAQILLKIGEEGIADFLKQITSTKHNREVEEKLSNLTINIPTGVTKEPNVEMLDTAFNEGVLWIDRANATLFIEKSKGSEVMIENLPKGTLKEQKEFIYTELSANPQLLKSIGGTLRHFLKQ